MAVLVQAAQLPHDARLGGRHRGEQNGDDADQRIQGQPQAAARQSAGAGIGDQLVNELADGRNRPVVGSHGGGSLRASGTRQRHEGERRLLQVLEAGDQRARVGAVAAHGLADGVQALPAIPDLGGQCRLIAVHQHPLDGRERPVQLVDAGEQRLIAPQRPLLALGGSQQCRDQ